MSSDLALQIRGIGKTYRIRHEDHDHVTLAQAALHRIRHPRGASRIEEFAALDHVEFDVARGRAVGIIGHNGAGKSTLLKILSRITPPTTGSVVVYGRVGALLEVGTGFHPELTGRENIYLNGAILGMASRDVDRQFDAIVDFAGVSKFLDTPVKRFSSGMYVRLAFAVAAHLDSDILLVDEVLAVGDAEFQRRCLGVMSDVTRGGRTVLFVSHNMGAVANLCTETIVLQHGRVAFKGGTDEAIRFNSESRVDDRRPDLGTMKRPDDYPLTGTVLMTSGYIEPVFGPTGTHVGFDMEFTLENPGKEKTCAIVIYLHAADGSYMGTIDYCGITLSDTPTHVHCHIGPLELRPAIYDFTLTVTSDKPRFGYIDYDGIYNAITVDIRESRGESTSLPRTWGDLRLPGWYRQTANESDRAPDGARAVEGSTSTSSSRFTQS